MGNKSDFPQKIMQPQCSPFHGSTHKAVTGQKQNGLSLSVKVPPIPSSKEKLQRPLHKSPANSHLFSRYAAGIMGQPSWREKYEIQDLMIPYRNNGHSDPFGTPLSKSAVIALQASLERVCVFPLDF